MTQQVLYSVSSGRITQWQDTALFSYPSPPQPMAVLIVSPSQWAQQDRFRWVAEGELSDQEPAYATPELTDDLLERAVTMNRDRLLSQATRIIAPLQDAIDLQDATEEEHKTLHAWKRYRVALMRIEGQAGFPHVIDWPVSPSEQSELTTDQRLSLPSFS